MTNKMSSLSQAVIMFRKESLNNIAEEVYRGHIVFRPTTVFAIFRHDELTSEIKGRTIRREKKRARHNLSSPINEAKVPIHRFIIKM